MVVNLKVTKSYETPNSQNGNTCIAKLTYEIKRKVKYMLNGKEVEDIETAPVHFHKGFKRMLAVGDEVTLDFTKYNTREIEESYKDKESGEMKVSRKVWLVVKDEENEG